MKSIYTLCEDAENNNFACCQRDTSRIGDRARLGGFDNNRGDQQVAATMRMRVQVKKFYESWSNNRESITIFFTQKFEPWCSFLSQISPQKCKENLNWVLITKLNCDKWKLNSKLNRLICNDALPSHRLQKKVIPY